MKSILTYLNSIKAKLIVIIFLIIFGSNFISSCKKTEVPPRFSSLIIEINHDVDGAAVVLDPFQFVNESGNVFSITDFKYYISNFCLTATSGEIYLDPNIYLVDIKKMESLSFILDSISPNTYNSISFDLGLDSVHNCTGALLNTIDNYNMSWPLPMGGGYHFLKFEGKTWLNGSPVGFAFHLGKNANKIHYSFEINKKMTFWNEKLVLHHNLNEWFKNPMSYNFEWHELYTMNNDSVMQVVKLNGMDVFSL